MAFNFNKMAKKKKKKWKKKKRKKKSRRLLQKANPGFVSDYISTEHSKPTNAKSKVEYKEC